MPAWGLIPSMGVGVEGITNFVFLRSPCGEKIHEEGQTDLERYSSTIQGSGTEGHLLTAQMLRPVEICEEGDSERC